MHTDEQIAAMSISEVVHLSGGNGLASPPFQVPMNFMGVYGWHHVEAGVEALVSGDQVMSKTRLASDWLRLFGRRKVFRRVMLQPAPLTDISAKALTRDRLELTLEVSVKYTVADPAYVATLQDPISEFRNLLIGCVAEYIRSDTLENIVSDDGRLRAELKRHLENSPTLGGHYAVTEVLKALPTGDERLLEIGRQKREEESKQDLIDIRGQNERLAAEYQLKIAAREAELQDALAERQHAREMEIRQLERQAGLEQTLMKALAEVAASGMDPSKLSPLLSRGLSGTQETQRPLLDQTSSPAGKTTSKADQQSQVTKEHAALTSIQTSGQIQSFEILGSESQLKGAMVRTSTYEIVLTCKDGYPAEAPDVVVRFKDGRTLEPDLRWISGVSSSLAQAVLSVIPQIKSEKGSSSNAEGIFRLNVDQNIGDET